MSNEGSHPEALYPPTPAFRLVSERATGAMHLSTLVTSAKEEEEEEEEGQITSEPSIGHGGDQIDESSIVSPKRKISPAPPLMEPSSSDKQEEPRKRKRAPSPDSDMSKLNGPGGQEDSRFRGVIIYSRSPEEAINFAMNMGNSSPRTKRIQRHIFWTDASIVFRACAAGAVVWKQPPNWDWKTEGFPYPYCIQSTDVVEMFAMAHALKRAVDEVVMSLRGVSDGSQLQIRHEVYVFTDSLGALTQVEKYSQGYPTSEACQQQAQNINGFSITLHGLGAKVELHLVPGHNSVPGNVLADNAAKKAAKSAAAAAQITSEQQCIDLYETQRDVPIFGPATNVPVPAVQVLAHIAKKPKTQHSPLCLPPTFTPIKAVEPPVRETEEKISHFFSDPDFVRADRSPDSSPAPAHTSGSGFNPINAGSISLPGFNSVSTSHKLPTVDAAAGVAPERLATSEPSQVQSSRPAKRIRQGENNPPRPLTKVSSAHETSVVTSPLHWFIPISARSSLPTAGPSQLISLSSPKSVTGKQAELGIVGAEYPGSSQGSAFGQAPVASSLHQKLPSDKATVSLQARKLSFDLTNKAPAACLEPTTIVAPPLSFALTSEMRSFASPTELPLRPIPGVCPSEAKDSIDTSLSFPMSLTPGICTSFTPFVNASKMKSFASPVEPIDGLTLLPTFGPSQPRVFDTAGSVVSTARIRSFASPVEPTDELTLRSISSLPKGELARTKAATLPKFHPSSPVGFDAASPILSTKKMRSFASPEEAVDGLMRAPISSTHTSTSASFTPSKARNSSQEGKGIQP